MDLQGLPSEGPIIDVTIDWDEVETSQTLEDVDRTDAIKSRSEKFLSLQNRM
jgi:hypothetical protein